MTDPLDSLFGDERFTEPDDGPAPTRAPRRRAAAGTTTTGQKVVVGIAGALVAGIALFALFLLGTRLPAVFAAAAVTPAVTPTPPATHAPNPTRTPTPTVAAGPLPAGVHGWNELRGGECLDPYAGPWAETYTVVDCAGAHPAQLVVRGTFDATTTPTFPGADALQAQISLRCSAPGVLDLAAAGAYTDAQLQGSYPVTDAQWDAGQHDYFCFVSRSSGQPLTGSVAVAVTAPSP